MTFPPAERLKGYVDSGGGPGGVPTQTHSVGPGLAELAQEDGSLSPVRGLARSSPPFGFTLARNTCRKVAWSQG